MLEQLQFIVTEVPTRHPNFFHTVQQSAFQAAAQTLEADIPGISDEEFYVRLCGLVAMGRDAHTSLNSVRFAEQIGFRSLPIDLRWLEDGVFVTGAVGEHVALNGARLLRVGDRPVNEVTDLIWPLVAHENDHWFRYMAEQFLRSQGVLRGIGVAPLDGPTTLTFLLRSGEQKTADLSPVDEPFVRPVDERAGFVPVTLRRTGENYWFEYWPETRILYIAYRRAIEMQDLPMARFAENVVATMDQFPIDWLVVDFRGNTGGDSRVFEVLGNALQTRFVALLQNQQFRAFGLIDAGTYSSGLLAAITLRTPFPTGMSLTTTVGQPTGGQPGSYGDVLSVNLPHSELTLIHSTRWVSTPSWVPEGDSFHPDVRTGLRSTDYFARHDAELAAVLARSGPPPAPPSGDLIVVNTASFRTDTGIAPGSLVSGFGLFSADGLEVLVNGSSATVLGAVANQVVFRVPQGTGIGPATVELRQAGATVAGGQFTVSEAGPGLLVIQPGDVTQPGAVLNQDSVLNSSEARAARGSIIQIFATGHGPLDENGQAEVRVWIAQHPAVVVYSGPAPGLPGVWQINVYVPDDLAVIGEVPLFAAAHGLVSNGVTIWVE